MRKLKTQQTPSSNLKYYMSKSSKPGRHPGPPSSTSFNLNGTTGHCPHPMPGQDHTILSFLKLFHVRRGLAKAVTGPESKRHFVFEQEAFSYSVHDTKGSGKPPTSPLVPRQHMILSWSRLRCMFFSYASNPEGFTNRSFGTFQETPEACVCQLGG